MGVVATVRDVAVRAGVSVGTVSNALNKPERVSEDTAARVMEAVRELGFVRNDAARQLRLGQSRAIGMVMLDMRNPFFASLALGAGDRVRELGHAIVLGNSDLKGDREAAYLDLFEEQRLRGVLISPFGAVEDRLLRLRERGASAVIVDSIGTAEVSSVSVDDVVGGRLVGRHLLETGRHHVAYVSGPLKVRQVQDRLSGLQKAMQAGSGTTVEIVTAGVMSIPEGRRCGELLASRSPGRRPDAVFASNDLLALGALHALVTGGVRVPEEVAVVGYDDIDFASAAIVPLTSVRQPAARIGASAVNMLIEETEGSEPGGCHKVFEPELVVRQSSVPSNELLKR